MERYEKKKIGRFIKNGDRLLNVISLRDFSFDTIVDDDALHYDNANHNLILVRYHDDETIKHNITPHDQMNLEVRAKEDIRPILQPEDFTDEWRKRQQRAAKRKSRRGLDEEDFDADLMDMDDERESDEDHSDLAPEPVPASPTVAQLKDLEVNAPQSEVKEGFSPRVESNLDIVGEAINALDANQSEPEKFGSPLHIRRESVETETPTAESVIKKSTFPVFQPETVAMEEYREVLKNPELTPDQLKQAIDKAIADGYSDGFRQGEEKASLQLRDIAQRVVENMESVLGDLDGLRQSILAGSEANFFEIAQALAEALIGRELSVDRDAFSQLISGIVKESVGSDQFHVHVHPEFLAELSKLDIGDLGKRLVEDTSVNPGDFRIESQQAVIDGNIKQMIAEMLKRLDLSLYHQKTEKAG